MEKCRESIKRWMKTCFEGDLTMPKLTFWLAAAVCLLAGVVYGLMAAPRTHGIHKNIGCNNGNANSFGGAKECRCESGEKEEQAGGCCSV